MKAFKQIAVLMMILTATFAVAEQMEPRAVVVDVPFSFQVGNKVLPAGHYEIGFQNFSMVLKRDSGEIALVNTHRVEGKNTADHSALVFVPQDGAYHLYRVWRAGREAGNELSVTKEQQNMARAANTRVVFGK